MTRSNEPQAAEVFVSYASLDVERVVSIVQRLEEAGVTVWRDGARILGGGNYGPEIVEGIERSNLLMLMCSAASMRSRNVKQELQLAWHYQRPYLPLLLDETIRSSDPDTGGRRGASSSLYSGIIPRYAVHWKWGRYEASSHVQRQCRRPAKADRFRPIGGYVCPPPGKPSACSSPALSVICMRSASISSSSSSPPCASGWGSIVFT